MQLESAFQLVQEESVTTKKAYELRVSLVKDRRDLSDNLPLVLNFPFKGVVTVCAVLDNDLSEFLGT